MKQKLAKWLRVLQPSLSLRTALVVYVVVPVALVLTIGGAAGLWALEDQMEHRLQEDVELVARAIQPALSRALEQGRRGSINQALEAAFSIDRVFGAYVYDSHGNTVAMAGRRGALPSGQVSRLAREGDQRGEFGRVAGREVYSYFVPLIDSGARIIGILQVTRRASDFEEYIGTLRLQAVVLALLVCGLVTGLVLYGHHGAIGRYLATITSSMREVEGGNHGHRSPVAGPLEISRLAGSLNAMLDSMQQAKEKIEQHRAAEMALSRQLRQSERMAALGRLAAGVAHESAAPLSVIYGKVQRLLRTDLPEGTRQNLRQVIQQVHRMERFIQQLLDFGRGREIQLRRILADRLANSALSSLKAEDSKPKHSVTVEGSRPAPELWVDPFQFEQALTNLLQNAVQASPGGHVKLSWWSRDRQVGFTVEDDGPGISEEIRHRLFEPFYTTKKPGEGTGLGLALVYRIIEEHGGRLEVGNSTMGGALFRIALPTSGHVKPGTEVTTRKKGRDRS